MSVASGRMTMTRTRLLALVVAVVALCPTPATAQRRPVRTHHEAPDSSVILAADSVNRISEVTHRIALLEEPVLVSDETIMTDTLTAAVAEESPYDRWEERSSDFNPDPTRAVWMAALFPGLGQIYNRRYWKLPIVVGGYLGLTYATSWNNTMLSDYTKAYRDIMDSDPTTKSYMDFFPPTTREEDLDKTWLTNILQSRKNMYRRNRDLCIICMVGLYLVAMVDAYVDASLSHFDISPDLTMQWAPSIFQDTRGSYPAVGISWALNF